MTEHRDVVAISFGPSPDEHERAVDSDPQCTSVLLLNGEDFRCALRPDHDPWPHGNEGANAVWGYGRAGVTS